MFFLLKQLINIRRRSNKVRKDILVSSINVAVLVALNACQSLPYQPYARDVKKKPHQGGLIALKLEHRPEDMALAQQMMNANCGTNPVKVLEEGEVVIGEKTSTQSGQNYDAGERPTQVGKLFGLPVMSGGRDPNTQTRSEASVTQIKEWQINYECDAETEVMSKASKGKKNKSTL